MKTAIPRYNICTVTTKDIELKNMRDRVKQIGDFTDETIYRRGLEFILREQNSS